MRDPVQEFMEYNRPFARRSADLLRFKVKRMAEGPFPFFRGTFHLFARDWANKVVEVRTAVADGGADIDVVGDLHSENFGTFKADDGLVHYDVNDFDETTRGRFDLDVCRLATSWLLAAQDRGERWAATIPAALAGLGAYADSFRRALKTGKAPDLDVSEKAPTHEPAVDELLAAGAARRRPKFIATLTEVTREGRRLLRSAHYFNLTDDERQRVLRLLEDYRRRPGPDVKEGYYTVEDACGRVSGIGSMGRYRYAVLLAGKGNDEARNVLLEFKESLPSALDAARGTAPPPEALPGRAGQVVGVQRKSQAASNPHLGFAVDGGLSFQVRELGPPDGRVDSKALKTDALLEGVARVQGAVLARVHARGALASVGPARPLAEVEDADAFAGRVLAFALNYADQVGRDFKRFAGARADLENVAGWAG
jgi:uncharacterized protein (DUF2252 family)